MKKNKKKVIIIGLISILILIIVLFILFRFLGGNYLKLEKSGNDKTIEVLVNSEDYDKPKVTCKFFDKDISKKNLKQIKDINVNKLGEQVVEYECKKSFFSKKLSIKYNVVDKESPILEINGDSEISIYVGDEYQEQGAKATDNYDGDITDKIEITGEVNNEEEGNYEIVYSVKDSSGNETNQKRIINVKVKQVPKQIETNNNSNPPNKTETSAYSIVGVDLSCGNAGVIYLTLDDGPNATYTPIILDILNQYNVKATFFVTSSGPDNLIKREFDEGHAVGIHSSTHAYDKIYVSSEAFWNDMNVVRDRVESITGTKVTLLRFPGGSSNTVSKRYNEGIMTRLAHEVEEQGYSYFDWNISSGDAGGTTDPNVEYYNVINNLSKSRGNVILMHDIKYHTSQAIENIVRYGLENGYTFDVLNNNIVCHQKVNN